MKGLLALLHRDALRFVRQPGRIIATVGTPVVFLAILGGGLAGATAGLEQSTGVDDARGYAAFLLPGLMGLSVLFAGVFAGLDLIAERTEGLLTSVLVGPTSMRTIITAKVIGASVPAMVQAALLLALAPLLGIGLTVTGSLLALLALAVLSIAVITVCLAAAWRCGTSASFHGIMNTVLMPSWLLGGAFFPVSGAAGWLKPIALANPMTWSLSALRSSMTNAQPDPGPAWLAWTIAIVFACIGVIFAGIVIRRRA